MRDAAALPSGIALLRRTGIRLEPGELLAVGLRQLSLWESLASAVTGLLCGGMSYGDASCGGSPFGNCLTSAHGATFRHG
ncbi:hypothetical protein [Paenibacillus sp. GCM10012306]|uniref:hypothetical protein n=1 Tax=Paenibacillus sp. GCM10012306 TaxID=3317342 RepID=UPI003618DB27